MEVKGNFSWGFDTEATEVEKSKIILKNIDLRIEKGEFVCIVGAVGAGKSSLLSAIIGDMLFVPDDYPKLTPTQIIEQRIVSPPIKTGGSLAYVS